MCLCLFVCVCERERERVVHCGEGWRWGERGRGQLHVGWQEGACVEELGSWLGVYVYIEAGYTGRVEPWDQGWGVEVGGDSEPIP